MGVDNSTLLRQTAQDIVNGMNQDGLGAFPDLVADKVQKAALKGTLPRRDSKDTMPRDTGGHAVGRSPGLRHHEMASDNYDMLQYDDGFTVTEQELIDLSQYRIDMAAYLETSRQNVNIALSADFQALLGAETNTAAAGNGAWSAAASTAVLDIQDGIKTNIPEAMTRGGSDYVVVCGLQSALELNRHENFLGMTANFAGSGMSDNIGGEFSALRTKLTNITGIPSANIYIGSDFYDSANEGAALSVAFLYGDFFWVGKRSALKFAEQPRRGTAAAAGGLATPDQFGLVTVKQDHNVWEVVYMRTGDFVRQDTQLGVRWTGI